MANKPETVPCKWCGEQTPMIGTQECNSCWELSRRIEAHPEIARRMVKLFKGPGGGFIYPAETLLGSYILLGLHLLAILAISIGVGFAIFGGPK